MISYTDESLPYGNFGNMIGEREICIEIPNTPRITINGEVSILWTLGIQHREHDNE